MFLDPEVAARISNLELVARLIVEGFMIGLHRSPYHGYSVEFSSYRKYSVGDDLRKVDWKVFGKTDRYYVKQFEEETNLRGNILLDTSNSMAYKSRGISKFEYGCCLAGALAYLLIRQQDSAGLVTFNKEITNRIPPHGTKTHLNEILETLENVEPGETTSLAESFHMLADTLPRRGLVIIISDLYGDEKEIMKALRHFRHKRHGVILFHVLDKDEIEFPFERLTDFVDLETNSLLHVDPVYVREEYLKLIKEFTEAFRRDCSQTQIEYIVTDTSIPFDRMLSAFLSRR